jgi:hypothetical protein
MRAALRFLAALIGQSGDDERYLVELGVILALIALIALLALVFLGDAVADLITLVGGRVDEQTLGH